MTDWEPATEAETAMRDALRAGNQELYFRFSVAPTCCCRSRPRRCPGRAPIGWGTWATGGRTHVLAFTSAGAMRDCLGDHSLGARTVHFRELADGLAQPRVVAGGQPGPAHRGLPAGLVRVPTGPRRRAAARPDHRWPAPGSRRPRGCAARRRTRLAARHRAGRRRSPPRSRYHSASGDGDPAAPEAGRARCSQRGPAPPTRLRPGQRGRGRPAGGGRRRAHRHVPVHAAAGQGVYPHPGRRLGVGPSGRPRASSGGTRPSTASPTSWCSPRPSGWSSGSAPATR